MDLNKLLKENMLRFGTKNLTYEHLGNIISEEPDPPTEPDLSKFDWSKNGTQDWASAPIKSLVEYVRAVDAGKSYTQYEIYKPVMQWWQDHDTEDTRSSLLIWIGGEANMYYGLKAARDIATKSAEATTTTVDDEGNSEGLKKLGDELLKKTNELKGTSTLDGQAKVQLITIAKMLIRTEEAGVSVTDDGFKKLSRIVTELPKSASNWKPTGGYDDKVVASLKTTVTNLKSMLTTGTPTSVIDIDVTTSQIKSNLTDDIRSRLLTQLQQQVDVKIANPKTRDGIFGGRIFDISVDKAVRNADTLVVTKDTSKLSVAGTASGDARTKILDTIVFHFAVPDLDAPQEQRDYDAQAMFEDDKTKLQSWSQQAVYFIADQLNQKIREIQEQFPDDMIKVQKFETRAFSATSCVNTSFGSGDAQGKNKVWNKANNVLLANARLKSMQDEMKTALNEELKGLEDEDGLILNKLKSTFSINAANVGPEWEFVGFGTLGDDGKVKSEKSATYIDKYGPMFQEAYNNDPTITPKKFYRNRKDNQALLADYQTTYANYRTATVSVQLEVLAPKNIVQQVAEGEYVVTVVSGYGAEITWTRRRKKKKRGRGGGGRRGIITSFPPMPAFKGRTLKCPNF
jgi:hypothetical protein